MSCHNCEKRKVGCHADCEDYRKFREEIDARKKNNPTDRALRSYVIDRKSHYMKKDRRNKEGVYKK